MTSSRKESLDLISLTILKYGWPEIRAAALDYEAMKARDSREPGLKKKVRLERLVSGVVRAHFTKQSKIVTRKLTAYHPDRIKATIAPPWIDEDELWDDPDFNAGLFKLLVEASKEGITLFGQSVTIPVDLTLVNSAAVNWAKKYTFDLVKGIDATTRTALQEAISAFADTPGMTIGDVEDLLPFGDLRSQIVARTEITRAYAQADQLAGKQLAKDWPDVEVIKQWFTNRDDKVCDICRPLDGKEVPIDEPFDPDNDIDNPPGHVGCYCWRSTRTRI